MNLEHLSKDKEQRKQQLSLIIHNCRVYGVEIKKELIEEYNKLNK
jgi:hypothetical protein|tara:strand:- start:355 stop:489 length:135 start_codon:yes stop_codon:yes gene_type:complete